MVQRYTDNPIAAYLKRRQSDFPGEYGEIFLTNRYGALVASTSKLTTFHHRHKYWWQAAFLNGEGKPFVDDRGFDTSVGGYVLGIVVPVRKQETSRDEVGLLAKEFNTMLDHLQETLTSRDKLEKLITEKDFLMKELNHRVKNNLAMIVSLINLKEYFQELLSTIFSFSKHPVTIVTDIDSKYVPTKTAVSLGLIINEIATNAIKHGFTDKEEARFTVSLTEDRTVGHNVLTLSNTGNPFPRDVDFNNPDTLGLRLISAIVDQLNGTIELQREPQPVFTIRFPLEETER